MVAEPIQILRSRIAQLDKAQVYSLPGEPDRDPSHFVWVMQSHSNTSMGPMGWAVIAPAEADALADSCRLIARISLEDRHLVDGPLCQGRQHWIATQRNAMTEGNVPTPTRSRFVDPGRAIGRQIATPNPHGIGLYTSSPARSGNGMWRMYLELFPSEVTSRPWYVWQVESREQLILELNSASDWAHFVEAYSRNTGGFIYPDWAKVSEDFAGVHVTARTVAAAQGFSFNTPRGLTAPAFWDVEQTLWLRWVFASVSLIDSPVT